MPSAEPAQRAQLSTVLTIPQVAKLAGWSRARMRRHLIARNRELDGALLVNVGRGKERPRWTVTITALQAIAPQWFNDPESAQRQIDVLKEENDDLRWRVTRLEKLVEMQTERIASLVGVAPLRAVK